MALPGRDGSRSFVKWLVVALTLIATGCSAASPAARPSPVALASASVVSSPTATVHYTPIPTATPTVTRTAAATPRTFRITGTVTEAGGASVSGLTVSAYVASQLVCAPNVEPPAAASGFRVGDAGTYRLSLPAGTYVLWLTMGRSGQYWDGQPNTIAGCQAAKRLTVSSDVTLDLVFR